MDPDKIEQLHVVKYPKKVLRQPTRDITEFDESLQRLADKMFEIMRESKGVGLAATQIGLPYRIFVANPTGEPKDDRVFINGRITESEGWLEAEEGCLSVPQVYSNIRRHQKVTIEAVDLEGKPFTVTATDLLARIIQHETDHLDGRLILDRMSTIAKLSHRRQIKYLEDLDCESDT
jgi:peptide deformylase